MKRRTRIENRHGPIYLCHTRDYHVHIEETGESVRYGSLLRRLRRFRVVY